MNIPIFWELQDVLRDLLLPFLHATVPYTFPMGLEGAAAFPHSVPKGHNFSQCPDKITKPDASGEDRSPSVGRASVSLSTTGGLAPFQDVLRSINKRGQGRTRASRRWEPSTAQEEKTRPCLHS